MKVKDSKEIVVAKITTRQAVVVAVISLFSTVLVASITNFDKLLSKNDEVSMEVGYYEGRASLVKRAFRATKETLQAEIELAQKSGKLEEADRLKELADEVRAEDLKFQERHNKHIEAIKNGKRLDASEIKTEANEAIVRLNFVLTNSELELKIADNRDELTKTELEVKITKAELVAERAQLELKLAKLKATRQQAIPDILRIPLYGKGSILQTQGEVCEIKKDRKLRV